MVRKVALIVAGVLLLGVGSSRADEAVLDQLYGNGVHYYFGGDFSRAYDSLSSAIRGGTKDPRAYYFRALAELRLGRDPDASADFEKGAALETADANGRFSVSQALERIQGSTRATLEQYRDNARAVAMQRDARNRQNVFEQRRGAEGVLLRRDVPPAELTPAPVPDRVAKPIAPATAPKAPVAVDKGAADQPVEGADPFAPASAKPVEGAPAVAPAKPADAPAENPFGDAKPVETPAAKPDAKPAEADPFGGPAAKPAETPAAKPAEKPADAGDPFSSEPKLPAKGPDKASEKPADAGDPFAAPAKPAEKPVAPAEKPAAAPDNKPAGAAADPSAVKPQPGAVRGIFKALVGSAPGDNASAAAASPAAKAAPAVPKQAAPADAAADPFGGPPVATKKSGPPAPDASAPPAADPSAPTAPPAAAPTAPKKSDDPFADEAPAKGAGDAKPAPIAPTPPAAKAPTGAEKGAPEMKKDDDPFKL